MKQIIYILMFAIIIQAAMAVYGGEQYSYVFENCNDLVVNITADNGIDEGEYSILSDCIETSNNSYSCECEDNYIFNMSFAINAVNHYTLTSNQEYVYYVDDGVVESSGSESSGSSGGGGVAPPKEIAVKINDKQTKVILSQGKVYTFIVGSVTHKIKLDKLYMDRATITIESEPQTATLYVGDSKEFNLDSGVIEVTLNRIKGGTAVFLVDLIEEAELLDDIIIEGDLTTIEETQIEGTVTVEITEQTQTKSFVKFLVWPLVALAIVIIVIVITKRIGNKPEENENE